MLRLPGKIAVAAAGLALAVSLFAVQASMPFEPELSISLSHPAPAANSNVTSVTHLPADNHVMVFWAHFLPVEWDVAPGTEVPIGDVVAQATMSVDVDCDDTIQTFGPFNLTNEEVDPGLIARWRGQITDWWFLVINLDREEDDNGKGAEIGWNMNASMTGFTEFHTRCAPMTFSITFFGQSSPSDAVVLTNPSEEGAYTWQGFYISTGAEHTTNRTVEVCVGLSCPTPTPTPTPTPSPMPCEPPPPWPVPPGDSDCDGFTDAAEAFIGTDPFAACGPNAWPPDFNDDGLVNVLDFIVLSAHFGTQSGDPGYSQRFDLNTDGFINVLDFIILSAFFGHECYDP